MGTEVYEQRLELPLLLHRIIHVRWFKRINNVIVFHLFIGPQFSLKGEM